MRRARAARIPMTITDVTWGYVALRGRGLTHREVQRRLRAEARERGCSPMAAQMLGWKRPPRPAR